MRFEDWKHKLVPFDYACLKMVENLTGLSIELKQSGLYYFYEADYSQHPDPDYVNAIYTAIEGRYGKRLIGIQDDAERQKLIVMVKFAQERSQVYTYPKTEPLKEAGDKYHTGAVWAMEVIGTVECANRLAQYTGGGSMIIPEYKPAYYTFIDNISGVIRIATEGQFIVKEETKPYRIITKEEFEKLWSKE